MKIQPINNQHSPVFGHTFKVSICVRNGENCNYTFINPVNNTRLYKNLNSKFISWLNHDYINSVREKIRKPRLKNRNFSERDKNGMKQIVDALTEIDTDYRDLNIARSVYNDKGLGYIATGIDVPIVEQMCGANQIGMARADAKELYGITNTPFIKTIVNNYKRSSVQYVKDEQNLLRTPESGREIMLRLNFIKTGEKKNAPVYEFDNFEFHGIRNTDKPLYVQGDLFQPQAPRFDRDRSYMSEYKKQLLSQVYRIIRRNS